jgi:hypothetical protein
VRVTTVAPLPTVVELRRYTLHPGRRDELIELFDREFVESQEEGELVVLGQFRDLDQPDHFVWLRGFPDMPARRGALTAFYDGPVWAAHAAPANATMIDSDDVRLLRPLVLAAPDGGRPPIGAPAPDRLIIAVVWSLTADAGADLIVRRLVPLLAATGPAPLAVLATEHAENTFPRLPVRTGEDVVVLLLSYPDEAGWHRHRTAVRTAAADVLDAIDRAQHAPPEIARLTPTGRSAWR